MSANPWFPTYKKAVIEAVRVFVPAFGATLWLQIQTGAGDFTDIQTWAKAVVTAAFLGGVKAVVKWIREEHGRTNYSHWSYKLPF